MIINLLELNLANLLFLIYSFSDLMVSVKLCYQDERFRAEVDFLQDEYLYLVQAIYSMRCTEFVHTILLNTEFLDQILHAFLVQCLPNKNHKCVINNTVYGDCVQYFNILIVKRTSM